MTINYNNNIRPALGIAFATILAWEGQKIIRKSYKFIVAKNSTDIMNKTWNIFKKIFVLGAGVTIISFVTFTLGGLKILQNRSVSMVIEGSILATSIPYWIQEVPIIIRSFNL